MAIHCKRPDKIPLILWGIMRGLSQIFHIPQAGIDTRWNLYYTTHYLKRSGLSKDESAMAKVEYLKLCDV